MEYMAYAKSLREAAEFIQKNRPELPDVVATYKKSADIIDSLLSDTDVDHVIRCKDCKFRFTSLCPTHSVEYDMGNEPDIMWGIEEPDGFCSHGESIK